MGNAFVFVSVQTLLFIKVPASHIVGLSSHFYAHIGAGPKVFHPLMSKLMWA